MIEPDEYRYSTPKYTPGTTEMVSETYWSLNGQEVRAAFINGNVDPLGAQRETRVVQKSRLGFSRNFTLSDLRRGVKLPKVREDDADYWGKI